MVALYCALTITLTSKKAKNHEIFRKKMWLSHRLLWYMFMISEQFQQHPVSNKRVKVCQRGCRWDWPGSLYLHCNLHCNIGLT